MQQKSNHWSEMNYSPIIHWIWNIVFNCLFMKDIYWNYLVNVRTDTFLQTSDLTFVASEFQIIFLQWVTPITSGPILWNNQVCIWCTEQCKWFEVGLSKRSHPRFPTSILHFPRIFWDKARNLRVKFFTEYPRLYLQTSSTRCNGLHFWPRTKIKKNAGQM